MRVQKIYLAHPPLECRVLLRSSAESPIFSRGPRQFADNSIRPAVSSQSGSGWCSSGERHEITLLVPRLRFVCGGVRKWGSHHLCTARRRRSTARGNDWRLMGQGGGVPERGAGVGARPRARAAAPLACRGLRGVCSLNFCRVKGHSREGGGMGGQAEAITHGGRLLGTRHWDMSACASIQAYWCSCDPQGVITANWPHFYPLLHRLSREPVVNLDLDRAPRENVSHQE